ncbi:hypothetical protein EVAR_41032_1 [Eumeta japonica]|uniref:Uncharacterized protein n=1 Tax=Eumeta variegata TaxID=151549 RepID=A0A4C1YXM9_EUMVA|nr:hypothetical protein EVAR_41032_1 [Eumeta japonica]
MEINYFTLAGCKILPWRIDVEFTPRIHVTPPNDGCNRRTIEHVPPRRKPPQIAGARVRVRPLVLNSDAVGTTPTDSRPPHVAGGAGAVDARGSNSLSLTTAAGGPAGRER